MSLQLIRPDINLDFVGKRHFFVILSTVINIAAIVLLFTRGLNNGVAIRSALASLDLGEITVQDFGKAGQSFLVRFNTVKNVGGIGPKLETSLTKAYGPGVAKVVR